MIRLSRLTGLARWPEEYVNWNILNLLDRAEPEINKQLPGTEVSCRSTTSLAPSHYPAASGFGGFAIQHTVSDAEVVEDYEDLLVESIKDREEHVKWISGTLR